MDIKLTLTEDHAELLISVLENEMESLEQDYDLAQDPDNADTYAALDMITEEIRVRLEEQSGPCLLYTSPSPRDKRQSRMPSSA